MDTSKDYLRYVYAGRCNIVASQNGMIQSVDKVHCAVISGEAVTIFNLRTLEKAAEIRRDGKEVTAFKFSDDRKKLAIGYADGEVHLYMKNKSGYDEPIVFTGHKTSVNCIAFSQDGFTLASGGRDSVIVLWDILNESGLYRLNGHTATITQLQFTQDDKFLISSSKDTQLKFWDLDCQSCFYTIADCSTEIYAFSLLKQDRLLIVGSANMEMDVYEVTWLENKKEGEEEEDENTEEPNAKKTLLIGSDAFNEENDQGNEVVKIRKRGHLIRKAKGKALQLVATADEALLCCLGSDTLIDVFRVFTTDESKKRLKKKLNHAKKQEGTNKMTENEVSRDLSILLQHVGTVETAFKVKWADFSSQIKTSDDKREYRLFTLLKNNTVHGHLVDLGVKTNVIESEAAVSLDQRGHRTDIRALAVTSNNAAFVSASSDSAILWDMSSLMPVNTFSDPQMRDVTSAIFSPNDKQVIFGTKDGSLFLFDVPTCALLDTLIKVHEGAIFSLKSLPNGHGFVSASADKKALFWRYSTITEFERKRLTFRQERSLELPDEILSMCISPNFKFIAFGLLDNTAKVYFLDKLKFFVSLYGHSLPVTCLDISPDSKLIATGSADKSVKIWGLDFGDCHRSLFAHDDTVTCVLFNKDVEEQLIWSAGKDGLIKQWNAKKFDQVQVLDGHFGPIRVIASTSDGATLISASHDKAIKLWELSEEIIKPAEEEERLREKEDLEKIVDAEDIVPGENPANSVSMAAKKNISSVKGAEGILEAVEIYREEILLKKQDPKHRPHTLVQAYNSPSLDHFILDAISKISSAHLERSLLLVPFDFVVDILSALNKCVSAHYRLELASRVILFLYKVNLNQLTSQKELLPFLLSIQKTLPRDIKESSDMVNFNLAALRLHKASIEDRTQIKLFRNVEKTKKTKKAIVKPVVL
ncbi:unnamed protein product [Bursaphelenchus okinawaensis]|uniref:Small-subunit processome Utp12 domain-containing protein n=1 Tax=Bursaphelenchus okinawaensis TaxID=465554 RepID=A0A811K911_9BILA|nr:unnamed protein product [Bursaphelenchus okinawaensis]CAG9094595.1 unnamed protein product [Bursaphelenchus okinawaensis]